MASSSSVQLVSSYQQAGYLNRQTIVIVDIISCAILVYDYALTFPLELDCVWLRRHLSQAHPSQASYPIRPYPGPMASFQTFDSVMEPRHPEREFGRLVERSGSRRRWTRRGPITQWLGLLKRIWGPNKILFLLCRYPVIIGCVLDIVFHTRVGGSFTWCRGLLGALGVSRYITIVVAEAIFTLRTLAVYSNARVVQAVLLVSFSAFSIMVLVMFGLFIGYSEDPNFLLISFVIVMVYEAGLALFMDAILFYFALFVVSLANVLTIAIPSQMSYSLSHFQLVMHSILACRSMLHIREEAMVGRREEDFLATQ